MKTKILSIPLIHWLSKKEFLNNKNTMRSKYRLQDDVSLTSQLIIEEISEYIELEYNLKPRPRLAKILKEAKEDGVEPSLIYGEDYYALEASISDKMWKLVNKKARHLLHVGLKKGEK